MKKNSIGILFLFIALQVVAQNSVAAKPRIVKTLHDSVFAVWDVIVIPTILFDFDKSGIRPESKDSLNKVYDFLMRRSNLVVEVGTHSDSRTSDKYSSNLTQGRARACMDYLVKEKGLPQERISAKGYGESQLLVKDAEIKMMQTKEEMELAHQKNRRTELKVLRIDYVSPK